MYLACMFYIHAAYAQSPAAGNPDPAAIQQAFLDEIKMLPSVVNKLDKTQEKVIETEGKLQNQKAQLEALDEQALKQRARLEKEIEKNEKRLSALRKNVEQLEARKDEIKQARTELLSTKGGKEYLQAHAVNSGLYKKAMKHNASLQDNVKDYRKFTFEPSQKAPLLERMSFDNRLGMITDPFQMVDFQTQLVLPLGHRLRPGIGPSLQYAWGDHLNDALALGISTSLQFFPTKRNFFLLTEMLAAKPLDLSDGAKAVLKEQKQALLAAPSFGLGSTVNLFGGSSARWQLMYELPNELPSYTNFGAWSIRFGFQF